MSSVVKRIGRHMQFLATDVELANPSYDSICQVALVTFDENGLKESWSSYVDPETHFNEFNSWIHGIGPEDVKGAPNFPSLATEMRERISGQVVVHHTAFDRAAYNRCLGRYSLEPFDCAWLDSARVARRAWEEFSQKGYGLKNLCKKLGIDLGEHHNAENDARVAGQVLLEAIKQSGVPLEDWPKRATQPLSPELAEANKISRAGNRDGPLFGEVLIFTGALSAPRREAADLADKAGSKVTNGKPSKKTTVLVVGDQDISKLAGHEKSSKHRHAEQLIREGVPIRIVSESDFFSMLDS